MEYYSVLKKTELLIQCTRSINLKKNMLSENAKHKNKIIAHFHFREVCRSGKFIEKVYR